MLIRLGVEFSANRELGRLQLGMCACQGLVPRVATKTVSIRIHTHPSSEAARIPARQLPHLSLTAPLVESGSRGDGRRDRGGFDEDGDKSRSRTNVGEQHRTRMESSAGNY